MKQRITKKSVKEDYKNIISIGYCNAQFLLRALEPYGYTCGGDGWHADIYHYDADTAIVTGYQPFGNMTAAYNLVHAYDERAREIWQDYTKSYEEQRDAVTALLDGFIENIV